MSRAEVLCRVAVAQNKKREIHIRACDFSRFEKVQQSSERTSEVTQQAMP